MFRRRNPQRKMFQTKQFVVASAMSVPAATPSQFFGADQVIIGPDQLFGISNTVQASMKRCVVVGLDYYFDGRVLVADAQNPSLSVMQNYVGIYKDTLDSSSVPDASGDLFLSVDQVNGTTNQQLFPERVIDRRSFTLQWVPSVTPPFTIGITNPGMSAERRVRRPLSLTSREALIARVEAFLPGTEGNTLEWQMYGVVTYRVDL